MKKDMQMIAAGLLLTVALGLTVIFEVSADTERTLPAGVAGITEIVDVLASSSTSISPIWPDTNIVIKQAYEETGQFRTTIGTSTVSPFLPLDSSFSVQLKSGAFLSVQAASDTTKLVVYQTKR